MDFEFTEEQQRFRQEVRDFCLSTPRYRLVDPTEESFFSPQYYAEVAARGWLGLHWPTEYGGQGRTWVETVILNEEMGYRRAPLGDLYYQTFGLFGDFCCAHGTEQQKKQYLPRIASGKIRFARGFTEPEAGYDLTAIQTYARPDGGDYIINGPKRFITGANVAEFVLLMARTNRDTPRGKGLSFFIVDMRSPGISVTPVWSIALRTNDLFFDDVRVPADNMIGEKDRALEYLEDDPHLRYETSLGFMLGGARRTFERLVLFAREDNSRCRLGERPEVRQKLADLAIEIEALRLMTYRVAWMRSNGLTTRYEVYLEKLLEAEVDQRLTRAATDMLGLPAQLGLGAQYAPMRGMLSILASASLISFLPGSPEVLKNGIARTVLDLAT